ncbi:PrpF, AcnD-accessory [Rhodococcus sp. 15-725-2-2b]|uniref:PrpF domain-containing protein n=1 Tax=unclassified Rhodococcus (in: high G+C Gram-positive bacteria) TaxID=192944 RepID=UPI000B9ABEB1|nr:MULTISPECIES: PrpF domain-containing protein [unclassified Rhodococcus (in: high G+C Gram-positive bacteria)]OZC61843.1 PrpF, AcnD-accessory [Rhodococcus sp. 06-469-3-2]OZD43086.1 PrpF, AcnD-accessory [Rhodococcus sp. 06-1477-1A]OZE11191.1 PrpF, AcnD-accessory [Rhodococcus sp. 05-2255-3C]OZE14417.1 PrpF, AcnD-accessory [Rhodococcus sp. 05-2255-3B1]OZE24900.1 PrpF, AcnD-accessory [Rhodococcus sp. 05-2255-2A2]
MFTLRGTWMRGGTSKCWLFNAVDIDPYVAEAGGLDNILTAAFGSGDPRQLDGVGGGSSTTSKAAIVRRSSAPGIDVDYLFAQVAIENRTVEWGSNCGNCATAIGLYAVQTGLVAVDDRVTVVRMRNENTGAILTAEISTPGGRIPAEGGAAVPGTTALGVPVGLTFTDPAPDRPTMLPTGAEIDRVTLGDREFRGTFVRAGAPAAFFDAADFGLDGSESNDVVAAHVPTLIALRRLAALRMGLSKPEEPVSHAVPKVGIIGPPVGYTTTTGERVAAADYDISVRMLSMMAPHPAIGLTSAVAVAAAATVTGGVVIANARIGWPGSLRIGTAAGVLDVDYVTDRDGFLLSVTLHRAVRRIATADLFVVPMPTLVGAQ